MDLIVRAGVLEQMVNLRGFSSFSKRNTHAYSNALAERGKVGFAAGSRKLRVPGVRGNLYALYLRFGVFTEQKCNKDEGPDREKVRH